ncbi:MAG TPA: alpha/beta hydrolase [Burkholderiales bacterium]|nr:alpha/beta hydrolase [Burkholderiales bacterium]
MLPEIPQPVLAEMAEIGPRWGSNVPGHVRRMIEAFTPVLARAPKDGVEVARDFPYGEDPRQVLDVYRPKRARSETALLPVVLFLHGGAFVDGEKDRTPEIYSNVLYYLARHGILGINVEYRLAPLHKYPSGTEDVRRAVSWARGNAATFGGDPRRLFLMAHSAGAAHTGAYAYGSGDAIAGHIVVSGRVRAEMWPDNPNAQKVAAYYGTDPDALEKASQVNYVGPSSPRTLIAVAEFENPFIDVHCAELYFRLARAQGRAGKFLRLEGHNHTSIIASMNTADERLGREVVAFVSAPR